MDFIRAYQIRFPRGITFGLGTSERVGEVARTYGTKKALIVTDRALGPAGIIGKISQALSKAGLEWAVYDGVVTEPTTDKVLAGLDVFKAQGCDFLIGLGGGSCIDAAKGIAVIATSGGRLQDYEGRGKVKKAKAPLILPLHFSRNPGDSPDAAP